MEYENERSGTSIHSNSVASVASVSSKVEDVPVPSAKSEKQDSNSMMSSEDVDNEKETSSVVIDGSVDNGTKDVEMTEIELDEEDDKVCEMKSNKRDNDDHVVNVIDRYASFESTAL